MTDYSSPFKKGDERPGRPNPKKKPVPSAAIPGPKDLKRMRRKGHRVKIWYNLKGSIGGHNV